MATTDKDIERTRTETERPPSGMELLREGVGTSRGLANPDPEVRAREHALNTDLTQEMVTPIDISSETGIDLGTGFGTAGGETALDEAA